MDLQKTLETLQQAPLEDRKRFMEFCASDMSREEFERFAPGLTDIEVILKLLARPPKKKSFRSMYGNLIWKIISWTFWPLLLALLIASCWFETLAEILKAIGSLIVIGIICGWLWSLLREQCRTVQIGPKMEREKLLCEKCGKYEREKTGFKEDPHMYFTQWYKCRACGHKTQESFWGNAYKSGGGR
jgi:hypothetical protein